MPQLEVLRNDCFEETVIFIDLLRTTENAALESDFGIFQLNANLLATKSNIPRVCAGTFEPQIITKV